MTDNITITGRVVTDPRHTVTGAGLSVTNFRLASTHRRFERDQGKWVDAETNWFSVSSFRHLADNTAASVRRGDLVVVTGRLRVKEWTNADKSGVEVDVQAEAIGHDLAWGTSAWTKTPSSGSSSGAPASSGSGGDADPPASGVAEEVSGVRPAATSPERVPAGRGTGSEADPPF